MAQHILDLLRGFLSQYGYWAVAVTLLLENAGLPVPGETILLLASFTAFSEHRLHLPYIIAVGVVAATAGDNVGFAIGHYGGRPFLTRYIKAFSISHRAIHIAEETFQKYGAATVLLARFIAGLRVVAGPLAGVLRMPWRRFALFNFLGAAVWVTTISCLGYIFGQHWQAVTHILKRVDVVLGLIAVVTVVLLWRRITKGTGSPA
jgi:membrane protein DedA with SNARE-associated domain